MVERSFRIVLPFQVRNHIQSKVHERVQHNHPWKGTLPLKKYWKAPIPCPIFWTKNHLNTLARLLRTSISLVCLRGKPSKIGTLERCPLDKLYIVQPFFFYYYFANLFVNVWEPPDLFWIWWIANIKFIGKLRWFKVESTLTYLEGTPKIEHGHTCCCESLAHHCHKLILKIINCHELWIIIINCHRLFLIIIINCLKLWIIIKNCHRLWLIMIKR